MIPVSDLEATSALMESVLDSIVAVFEQADVSLPDRRYIAVGQTAHDCEQVTVSFLQMYLGTPGAQADTPQPCHSPRSAVLQIQIVRKLPAAQSRLNTTPDAQALTENTRERTKDAWLLMDAATQAVEAMGPVLADVGITDPQGEYQAIVLNLSAGIP